MGLPAFTLKSMDGISGFGASGVSTDVAVDMAMLKQTQDLMKEQGAALLAALPPPPRAPSPRGVGDHIDILG